MGIQVYVIDVIAGNMLVRCLYVCRQNARKPVVEGQAGTRVSG